MRDRVLLYVEDDDSAHYLLSTVVRDREMNVDVQRVSDGRAALAFLRHGEPFQAAPRPDLILLDLNLPGTPGLTVLSDIRHDPALSGIPVVVFSSSSRSTDKAESLALGADEYITKPGTYEAFVRAVISACSFLPD